MIDRVPWWSRRQRQRSPSVLRDSELDPLSDRSRERAEQLRAFRSRPCDVHREGLQSRVPRQPRARQLGCVRLQQHVMQSLRAPRRLLHVNERRRQRHQPLEPFARDFLVAREYVQQHVQNARRQRQSTRLLIQPLPQLVCSQRAELQSQLPRHPVPHILRRAHYPLPCARRQARRLCP